MHIEDLGRSIATIAVWSAPAFTVWATGVPEIAWGFIASLMATIVIWND